MCSIDFLKDNYIKLLARKSRTDNHELIVECLNRYDVTGTRELAVWQLAAFCERKGII